MAKTRSNISPDSSLSPPPDDLAVPAENTIVKKTVTRKRKAATKITTVPKRPKTTATVNTTSLEDVRASSDPPLQKEPKESLISSENVEAAQEIVGDEIDLQESDSSSGSAKDEDKIKIMSKPRKKTRKKTKVAGALKELALDPMVKRTEDTPLAVGAHVTGSGGAHNAVISCVNIGGNAFAFFLKNQRKWGGPELDPRSAELFIESCKKHGIDAGKCCLPHGSYLVNLAHPDPARKKQAYDSFLDDLTRCHKLGIKLYNFHPGNSNAGTHEEGIRMIAQNINEAHQDPATGEVITVLETMASQGNTIGGSFADLANIIKLVINKDRVGVCLDTCHVFAAGYDLRSPRAYASTMKLFDKVIGLKYLKAFHMNDSKAEIFSNRDLHARIGTRHLGLRAFHNIVNDERLHGIPMVLETPGEIIDDNGVGTEDKGVWAREIKLLESLVGMDANSDEFKSLEAKLREEGARDIKNEGLKKDLKAEHAKSKKAAKNTANARSDEKPTKPARPKAKTTSKEQDATVAKPRASRARTKVPDYADDASDE